MHILIVTQYFWPESFIVNSLATELQSLGNKVTVYTGLPNYPEGDFFPSYGFFKGPFSEKYQGIDIQRVPIFPRKKGFFNRALNYLSFVISGTFFAFRKPKDIDVILVFGMSPILMCLPAIVIKWLTGKKLVLWVQDLWPESVATVSVSGAGVMAKLITPVVKFIYKQCDLILTQSQAFKPSIINLSGDESKIHYVPNWADPFEQIAEPEWVKQLPGGFKIGFAGNVGTAQDMKTLVKAAQILRDHSDIVWVVAGDGSMKQWLDEQIIKLKLEKSIKTVGKKPYNEMLPFFQKCEAMYVSLTKEHIFSLTIPAKVQAYMSSNRPLLSCLNGEGSRVITEAGCGLVANSEDAVTLAQNVLKLKEMSSEQRIQMGQNGLQFFQKNFKRSLVIDHINRLLKTTETRTKI